MCGMFADFFTSVYQPSDDLSDVDDLQFQCDQLVYAEYEIISFSPPDVKKVLKKFDMNKVASSDGVPVMFYRNLADSLALPLSILFNKSLSCHMFPSRWKEGFISPIYKEGDRQDVTDFRPVTILCAISKIFERLVYDELFSKIKNKIHESQHGFFAKKSTLSNLLEFVTPVSQSMTNGGQVDVLYTDFSKAFDRIIHSRLLKKLALFGFNEPLVR